MADLSHYNQRNLFASDVHLSHLLEEDDLCFLVKEAVGNIKDSDFEEMYKEGGRPPVSPRLLALVLLMQFIEGLSDRAAVRNLKFRLDWKIAFGLPVEFSGVHSSTLTYFRERLVAHSKVSFVFDQILEHLVANGLVKPLGKQRIDSTHVIGFVQELSRIELLTETLRLFCLDIGRVSGAFDESTFSYYESYVREISFYRSTEAEKKAAIKKAGLAMKTFISLFESKEQFSDVIALKSFKTLKTVFHQNFDDLGEEPELIKVATGKGHVCSPHEPEAEYANKGKKGWLGYKAQVTETVEAGNQNFVTHIEMTPATDFDGDAVLSITEELEQKGCKPSTLFGDTHYNTSKNIDLMAEANIALEGEVMPISNEKKAEDQDFTIDLNFKKVTCPMGIDSKYFNEKSNGLICASFPKSACQDCLRRDICKPQPRGKIYTQRPENKTLSERRRKLKDPEYRKELHQRNGIEGTISGLVRGQKLRRCRYRGINKANLQAKMSGAAANVVRLHTQRLREIAQKERMCA